MRRRHILLATLVLAVALTAAACGGGEPAGGGTTTQAPAESEPAPPPETGGTETQPGTETMTLSVYFMRGDEIGVARREVPQTESVGRAALEELLQGPTQAEQDARLGSEIPEGTELLDLSIADGVATVDLSGEFAVGGGSLTMFARLAQVVHTLTQFPTVQSVQFELDGEPVTTFSSEGIVLDGPQTREDYEDVAPAILVETPAVGDTVSSALRLTGTANTFEATFNYELLDATGAVIAENFVTATCGTGCRGTFDESIPFEWSGEPHGTLVVFEISAEDGSRTKVVEIPLAFE